MKLKDPIVLKQPFEQNYRPALHEWCDKNVYHDEKKYYFIPEYTPPSVELYNSYVSKNDYVVIVELKSVFKLVFTEIEKLIES